jgi:hypothetical protein
MRYEVRMPSRYGREHNGSNNQDHNATHRHQASKRLLHSIQLQHLVQPGLAVFLIESVNDAPHDTRSPIPLDEGYGAYVSGLLRAANIRFRLS